MISSPSISKLVPALLSAQRVIRGALKDSENPYFNSKYANLASVIDAVKQPLNDSNIVFVQGVGFGEGSVTVETMLIHESGEFLSSTLELHTPKANPQEIGKAITYGKRYGLQAMCGVPSEDDDGNEQSTGILKGSITPTTGAWEAMDPEMQKFLQAIADEMKALGPDYFAAVDYMDSQRLDDSETVALWTRFDSKLRSALKKAQQEKRKGKS